MASQKAAQQGLGAGALLLAATLYLLAIPHWVSSPSNVPNVVLSPLFWPNIISALLALVGIALLLPKRTATPTSEHRTPSQRGFMRLFVTALLLAAYLWGISFLGMVWASILAFIGVALLMGERRLRLVILLACLMPLVLYAFFAHVAGVAIPQGTFTSEFFRLP